MITSALMTFIWLWFVSYAIICVKYCMSCDRSKPTAYGFVRIIKEQKNEIQVH